MAAEFSPGNDCGGAGNTQEQAQRVAAGLHASVVKLMLATVARLNDLQYFQPLSAESSALVDQLLNDSFACMAVLVRGSKLRKAFAHSLGTPSQFHIVPSELLDLTEGIAVLLCDNLRVVHQGRDDKLCIKYSSF
eukprot:624877-Amphidinium_carterae.2